MLESSCRFAGRGSWLLTEPDGSRDMLEVLVLQDTEETHGGWLGRLEDSQRRDGVGTKEKSTKGSDTLFKISDVAIQPALARWTREHGSANPAYQA
jgi:hypothetical protein